MIELQNVLFFGGSYLLGAVPFGLIISRMAGVDVRLEGSRNIGATNVGRVLGTKLGALTLFCDGLKGFLPMLAAARLLPAADDSFGFYVIGRLPGATVREGGFETLHLDADGGDRRVLVAEHGRALRYLGRAAGARQLAPLRSTVVWIGGATDDGTPVGVAGYRTLLLSTATRDGRMQQEETALAWLLREQLLQAMPDRLPTWARESLAQYYAIRALRRSELPPSAVAMVERRLLDAPAPHSRLREAQRPLEAGDEPARAELRAAGATFWERVDRAIVRKSGFRTLDSVLPQLLAAQWPGGRLPPAVRERLQRYAGESAIEELLAQYVGD